jgi:hypothetical protein
MKVGILGSGDVAKALAAGFIKHGHQVTLGTRDVDPGTMSPYQHGEVFVTDDTGKLKDIRDATTVRNALRGALKNVGRWRGELPRFRSGTSFCARCKGPSAAADPDPPLDPLPPDHVPINNLENDPTQLNRIAPIRSPIGHPGNSPRSCRCWCG